MKAKKDIVIQDESGRSRKIFAGKPVPEPYLDAYKAAIKENEPKEPAKAKAEKGPEVSKMETAPEVSKARKQS